MNNELMMIIIDKEGIITGMYSDTDFLSTDSLDDLVSYIESKKRREYAPGDFEFIRHLFCMKSYGERNYPDMELSDDDLTMYYKLTQRGNILLINSRMHVNLMFAPDEITSEQKEALKRTTELFSPNLTWSLSDNVYLETFEQQGKRYATVELGDSRYGKLDSLVNYLVNKDKVKKID